DMSVWPAAASSPRDEAEPALSGWAARLLGDPARVRLQALYQDPQTGETLLVQERRLRDLPVSPLDLLQLAQATEGDRYPDAERLFVHLLERDRPSEAPAAATIRL